MFHSYPVFICTISNFVCTIIPTCSVASRYCEYSRLVMSDLSASHRLLSSNVIGRFPHLSNCLFCFVYVIRSVCLSGRMSVCLSVCLYVSLSACSVLSDSSTDIDRSVFNITVTLSPEVHQPITVSARYVTSILSLSLSISSSPTIYASRATTTHGTRGTRGTRGTQSVSGIVQSNRWIH